MSLRPRRRPRPRLLGLVLSLALVAAGCGHGGETAATQPSDRDYRAFCADNPGACGPHAAATTSPAPSRRAAIAPARRRAPSRAAVAAARRRAARLQAVLRVPAAERCHTAALSLSPGEQISPETGEHGIIVRLTNHGPPCTLAGYPAVTFLTGRRRLPFRTARGGRYGTGGTPRRVRLPAGGHAYFIAAKYRCDGQSRRSATAIRVRLAGATGSLLLRPLPREPGGSRLDYCREYGSGPGPGDPGNEIDLSPISTRAHLFAPS